ncbi:MAG: helix-turn-helix domain-containing protein [Candidatus Gastranaerophilaceae bacterium]|nr:transcriptional regulator [Clostridium sp. CAG:967]
MDKEKLKNNISNNIRLLRTKNRISQDKLSELAGINQQQISFIENGKACPKLETVIKIAEALNVTVNDLIY